MQPQLTVAGLLQSRSDAIGLPLELLSGQEGAARTITSPHIQKTGLALAGFHEYLQPGRVLVFGESEVRYLDALDSDTLLSVLASAFTHDIPCVLITGGWTPPPQLLAACERFHVPLLRTSVATPAAIAKIGVLLESLLAVRQVVHGVLMDILSLGVLVVRGHRLVADDAVEVRRRGETDLIGTCPDLTRHHMEVRGLGVINIRDLFGVGATRLSKRMELVVQLERWDTERAYDRLGIEENVWELFGVRIPLVHMPVAPGRNLAILVEVAARNQLLRARGLNAARELAARLDQHLREAEGDAATEEDVEHGGPV
jgi:HPr kinase/phosphorylase